MAADVNLLKNRADCLVAKAALLKERAAYARSDYNQTYSAGVSADRASTHAADLAKAQADVTKYTTEAARTDLSEPEMRAAKKALITAKGRVDILGLGDTSTDGPTAYLRAVDADQVDRQLATLDEALAAVQARHDALPA